MKIIGFIVLLILNLATFHSKDDKFWLKEGRRAIISYNPTNAIVNVENDGANKILRFDVTLQSNNPKDSIELVIHKDSTTKVVELINFNPKTNPTLDELYTKNGKTLTDTSYNKQKYLKIFSSKTEVVSKYSATTNNMLYNIKFQRSYGNSIGYNGIIKNIETGKVKYIQGITFKYERAGKYITRPSDIIMDYYTDYKSGIMIRYGLIGLLILLSLCMF